MENDKTTTYVYATNVETTLKKIDVKMSKIEPEQIEQVRFICDDGDITFKPKIHKNTLFKGLNKIVEQPMSIEEFAAYPKTSELVNELNKKGTVKLKLNFTIMSKENIDSSVSTYRYIQYLSQYDEVVTIKREE